MSNAFEIIGFGMGLLGSVLGIISFLYFLNDRIARVRIYFKMSIKFNNVIYNSRFPFTDYSKELIANEKMGINLFPGIVVINIGRSVFVVEEVGFTIKRSINNRFMLAENITLPEMKRPYRLNPGDLINLYATQISIFDLPTNIKYVYVITSTEKIVFKRLKNFKKVMAQTNSIIKSAN